MKNLFFAVFLVLITLKGLAQVNNSVTNSNSVPVEEKESAPPVAPSNDVEEIQIQEVKALKKSEVKSSSAKKSEESMGKSKADMTTDLMRSEQNAFLKSNEEARVQRTQRNPSRMRQETMDDAVTYFEKNAPESFEYHYFKYLSGNYDTKLRDHLLQAEKLRPENSDVHLQLTALYEIEGQEVLKKEYLSKLANNGRIQKSMIDYASDVLLSCQDGDFLVTHALEDAAAIWYQQSVGNIKGEVKIVSLDLLQSETYREHLRTLGLDIPESDLIDTQFLKNFLVRNTSKSIDLSMTLPKEYFTDIANQLYVKGLTFVYSENGSVNVDNVHLWNNTLGKHLVEESTDDKGRQLSSNYLPMLIVIREAYVKNNEQDKRKEIDKVIQHLVIQSKKQYNYSKIEE